MAAEKVFDVIFDSEGVCVGKLRNEVTNTAHKPFQVSRMLATDEGTFQGGEDTAPTPLEFFLTGLVGCLMTQIRVFAKKKKIPIGDLTVSCRAHWEAVADPDMPYAARPAGFVIDISLDSDAPEEAVRALLDGAKRACFVEATLAQKNDIQHNLRLNSAEPVAV
ncbi:OsmC family protein [Roseivivax sp. GX 12232]|uniref:OsmC family protein n=1 Tax=Roseivivax sp. GX 12232 TaxID=2900547 RepID=UPI001E425B7C|nr:OsmC family protein [Roseivivax sp. GX 12232]MCE0504096.1 OsmC family protein [Roseivivax sp. GX 12232]